MAGWTDLRVSQAVSLNWILKTLNTVNGKTTNLLFLDSCRINTADDTFKGQVGSDA